MRNIPTITKNLLIINVLMFAAYFVFSRLNIDLNSLLGLHFFLASDFHLYQLVTYMFMHAGLSHIFFNMFALWMFGRIVETVWGSKRFLTYYLTCGIGAGLIQFALNTWTTVGASGAIYGILLAFGMLFPEERIFIFPLPVPIKAKWFVAIYAVLELSLGLGMPGDSVAHFAHLGGMLFGYLLIRYWQRHPNGGYGGGFYGGGYGSGYGSTGGRSIADKLKDFFSRFKKPGHDNSSFGGGSRESDWDYNARKNKEQKEIDHILDKIRKSGYDSLSEKEKRKLFENGKK